MSKKTKSSSLLAKYTLMYEKKPRSRVFAPLAETYRKIGMIDEALKILKEGIKNHPSYTLGYVVLGSCYFDMQNYEMSYNTIRPFVSQNLENITLQKLFAKTCINLGYLEEALQTFKYLLLINPKDQNVADQIKLLEDDLLVNVDDNIEPTSTDSTFSEDDWVQVNFSSNKQIEEKVDELDSWKVEKNPLDKFKEEIGGNVIQITQRNLDDEYFHEDFDNKDNELKEEVSEQEEEIPFITHTLVDLYCSQGHIDRAIVVLENILELHPNDESTKQRLAELKLEIVNKNENHEETNRESKNEKVIKAYKLFNTLIQNHSKLVLSKI